MTGDNQGPRIIAGIAAFCLALGVSLGAIGAHALTTRLDSKQLDSWKTAVFYHIVHGLAILILDLLPVERSQRRRVQIGMLLGVACFSGSIYLMTSLQWTWLWPVTPLGGLCFIAAWLYLAFLLFRRN